MRPGAAARERAAALNPQPMEIPMNRILEVTDEDETLVFEFVDIEDLKDERILPATLLREWSRFEK
jgi:hypothetical protein